MNGQINCFAPSIRFLLILQIPVILWSSEQEPGRMINHHVCPRSSCDSKEEKLIPSSGGGVWGWRHIYVSSSCGRGRKGYYLCKGPGHWVLHAHKAPSTERGESLMPPLLSEVHIESKCQFHSRPYFGSLELSHPFKVHAQVM